MPSLRTTNCILQWLWPKKTCLHLPSSEPTEKCDDFSRFLRTETISKMSWTWNAIHDDRSMEKVPKTSTTKYMKEISDVVDEGRQLFKCFSMMMTWPKFLTRPKKRGSQNTSNVSPKARTSCNLDIADSAPARRRSGRHHQRVSFFLFTFSFLFRWVAKVKTHTMLKHQWHRNNW